MTASHPAWVCGLKLNRQKNHEFLLESHPAWVCGLKPDDRIQTGGLVSHTLRGCVD